MEVIEIGLLENISSHIGLEYLSDLRFKVSKNLLKSKLECIPDNCYPLSEWNDAVQYITDADKSFLTSSDAREFLIQYLTE